MKKKLTVRGINALKPAEPGKRYEIWDTEAPASPSASPMAAR